MIIEWVVIATFFIGVLTNTYYAGKGEYVKSRNSCIGDALAGTALIILSLIFWNV